MPYDPYAQFDPWKDFEDELDDEVIEIERATDKPFDPWENFEDSNKTDVDGEVITPYDPYAQFKDTNKGEEETLGETLTTEEPPEFSYKTPASFDEFSTADESLPSIDKATPKTQVDNIVTTPNQKEESFWEKMKYGSFGGDGLYPEVIFDQAGLGNLQGNCSEGKERKGDGEGGGSGEPE